MWPNRSFLVIWSHLLKKFLMKNFILCAMIKLKNLRGGKLAPKIPQQQFFQNTFYPILNLCDAVTWSKKSEKFTATICCTKNPKINLEKKIILDNFKP